MGFLLGTPRYEGEYTLVVNDGVFAGGRVGLLALDRVIRGMMPRAEAWVDQYAHHTARNQFIFNLALAVLQCGVELDRTFNFYEALDAVQITSDHRRLQVLWQGRAVRILHFCGSHRRNYATMRNLSACPSEPMPIQGDGDGYRAFLIALRGWVGCYGLEALSWSLYGTTDGKHAEVRDPSTLPLLALLHYLIRANGCVRVLESGTGRGVSTACLASAVAHRHGGRVVTLDRQADARRDDLWQRLPTAMLTTIELRQVDAIVGLDAMLAAGERFEAALLDSDHSGEHVWQEFQRAQQLVCKGGLILVHDAISAAGTVEQGLQRIEAAGYNVVRLWAAAEGVQEDDRLGLAVIENRRRWEDRSGKENGRHDA